MRKKRHVHHSIDDAFWACATAADSDMCWEWQGSINSAGYGQLTYRGKHYAAHRLAYELSIGPVTERDVMHLCDNRKCVNPAHLVCGSRSANMKDAQNKGRLRHRFWEHVKQHRNQYMNKQQDIN